MMKRNTKWQSLINRVQFVILFSFILLISGTTKAAEREGQTILHSEDTLWVSDKETLHLRFSSKIRYVDLGDRMLLAKVIEGGTDLAIKAKGEFGYTTSLTCLEYSGKLSTFVVGYRPSLGTLVWDVGKGGVPLFGADKQDPFSLRNGALGEGKDSLARMLISLPRELYHLGDAVSSVEISVENLVVEDDILFLLLGIDNHSSFGYEIGGTRFTIEEAGKTRGRGMKQEKTLSPVLFYGKENIAKGEKGRIVVGLEKPALGRGQLLRINIYEKDGSRNFSVELVEKDLRPGNAL